MSQQTLYPAMINSPSSTLTSSIISTDSTLLLSNIAVLPSPPNLLTIGYDTDSPETCLYTNISGNTITVQRGIEGIAQSWNIGTKIARVFTAYDYNSVISNIEELNSQVRDSVEIKIANRNSSGFITKITKGDKIYTLIRDINNNIISWEVG